jgi:hypothetical protein
MQPTEAIGRSWRRRLKTTLWTGSPSEPEQRWHLHNETPWPIRVEGAGGRTLLLAPFERRLAAEDPRPVFPLQPLLDQRKVRIDRQDRDHDDTLVHAVRLAVVLAVGWLLSVVLLPRPVWLWGGGILGATLALTLFSLLTRPARLAALRGAQRWTLQSLTMMIVIVVAVVGPALALWFGTDLHREVELGGPGGPVQTDRPLELIGRLLQLTLIAVGALLPALLFFQFDAERLSTLRDRWLHNIFRLDPSMSTVTDVKAKYGRQIEEAYGSEGDGRGRLTRGRRSPLIVATLVITFGWLLILINADVQVGAPGTPVPLPFTELLAPVASPIAYAFLGAYFFSLNLVHNSYARGDLRPKTYNLITARILLVVILAWLLQLAFRGATDNFVIYALAFAAGLVPRTVLHLLLERLSRAEKAFPRLGIELSGTGDQLVTLHGIDLYERTRLSDEGVTTLQALANHDLVDLFFKTRIAASRLVNWVDQATLQVYLADWGMRDSLAEMRKLSIHTATEFLTATDPEELTGRRVGAELIARAVGWPAAEAQERVALLRNALTTSEWCERILYWKGSKLTAANAGNRLHIGADGALRSGDPRFRRPRHSDESPATVGSEMATETRAGGRLAQRRVLAAEAARRFPPTTPGGAAAAVPQPTAPPAGAAPRLPLPRRSAGPDLVSRPARRVAGSRRR